MAKLGIPVFQSRVSPVFDTCTRLLVITYEQDHEIDRSEVYLDKFSITDRLTILRDLGITVLICGGISDTLYQMLKETKIRLIAGIAGQANQIFDAFLSDHLHEPSFLMPGNKTEDS